MGQRRGMAAALALGLMLGASVHGEAQAGLLPEAERAPMAGAGIRLGPLETTCLDVPGAEVGDLALVNVTVVAPTANGHLTAHNELGDPSQTSTVNFLADQTVPAMAMVEMTDQRVACMTNSVHTSAYLVVDLAGVFPAATVDPYSATARRVFDSRRSAGAPVAAGATVCSPGLDVAPGSVVVANVTAAGPSAAGHLTVHAKGVANPSATSTVNYLGGVNRANLTLVEVASGSELCATVSPHASTHVIFDVVATFDRSMFDRFGAAERLVDTRRPASTTAGARVAAGDAVCTEQIAAAGSAVVANVTATGAAGAGHLNTHAAEASGAGSSTHNYVSGTSWANLTVTTLGESGRLCVTPFVSAAHVVIDVLGVVASERAATLLPVGRRLADTRRLGQIPGRIAQSTLQFGSTCDAVRDAFVTPHLERLADYQYQGVTLPATNGNGATTVPDHSETNVQVAGIDEGDLVETDGRYLYREAPAGRLEIIDLERTRVAATVPLDGEHAELILHDDRLMVTTAGFENESTTTNVAVIDVSSPDQPRVLDRYGLTGTRVAMRGVDGNVHLILNSYRRPYGYVWDDPDGATALIEGSSVEDWLPQQYDIVDGSYANPRPAVGCDDVGIPDASAGGEMVWVSSLDMHQSGADQHGAGIVARVANATVMATADRLYVSTTNDGWWNWWGDGSSVTGIHLFDLSGPSASYAASTDVPGRVLNQFSIAEHDGLLRVAVTAGWWDDSASAVFVLRRVGDTFERISAVGNLGVGERIFAVRHIGPMSYVVTFREVDPLYVVDFSDPMRPVLRGELKIPGFSTYLHPVGADQLIGIGLDVDPDTGVQLNAQVSLFDVDDPDRPARTAQLQLPGWVELHDHRAVLVWPPAATLAVPGQLDATGESVLYVTRYLGSRLIYAGAVYAPECSTITRGVVVGDRLIAVGTGPVQMVDLTTLAPIATIGTCQN